MQKLIILTILVAFIFALNPKSLEGKYTNGGECQSAPCPRTYNGKYNFACPKSGDYGQIIYNPFINQYVISFKTYNMFSSSSLFQASFTESNIVTDYYNSQQSIEIELDGGYTLHIMPCYSGLTTADVCSTFGGTQLAVWKTKNGYTCDECAFSMTWYANN